MTATTRVAAPASVAELGELLRSRPGRVRLCGGGSRQQRVRDARDALHVQLTALASIVRLDAADQTCTVDCGVPRPLLDAELAHVGLELPCAGGGTIGGLFASDPIGATTAGGPSPRTLLLGCEGMLADGTAFRSGARVVKSVAGFDVHRLLIGSEGRLFIATRLHLRLAPRPRAQQFFCADDLDGAAALELVHRLRALTVRPAALQLQRDANGAFVVCGRIAGRASFVTATMRACSLHEGAAAAHDHVAAAAGGEVLGGFVLPSQLPALLAAAPADAPLLWHGGGRFEIALCDTAASDALLVTLQQQRVQACISISAASRRGHGTILDPGQLQLASRLKRALDPDGVLV